MPRERARKTFCTSWDIWEIQIMHTTWNSVEEEHRGNKSLELHWKLGRNKSCLTCMLSVECCWTGGEVGEPAGSCNDFPKQANGRRAPAISVCKAKVIYPHNIQMLQFEYEKGSNLVVHYKLFAFWKGKGIVRGKVCHVAHLYYVRESYHTQHADLMSKAKSKN